MGLFDFLDNKIRFSSEPLAKIFGLKEPVKFTTTVGKVLGATAVVGAGVALASGTFADSVIGAKASAAIGTAASGIGTAGVAVGGTILGAAAPILAQQATANVLKQPTISSQVNPNPIAIGTAKAASTLANVAQDNTSEMILIAGALVALIVILKK